MRTFRTIVYSLLIVGVLIALAVRHYRAQRIHHAGNAGNISIRLDIQS